MACKEIELGKVVPLQYFYHCHAKFIDSRGLPLIWE